MKTFGQYLMEKRRAKGAGLRQFCIEIGVDPSNYSKWERDIVGPPSDALKKIARGLDIPTTGPEWRAFKDKASAARGEVPGDLLKDRKQLVLQYLPAFFQQLRDHELEDGEDQVTIAEKLLRKAVK